jgi:SAM-dependent methyltransferase
MEQIEAEYCKIAYPMLLVDDARRAAGMSGDLEMTYGETPPTTMLQVLEVGGATSDDVFYDMGCGLGLPTVVAAHFCKKAVGFEILPEVAEKAREVAGALGLGNAVFELADFKTADVTEGTFIFCYATCLREQSRAELAACVSRTRSGSRIVTVTHNLEHTELELIRTCEIAWEGYPRAVYVHVRR